jgi:hypothetical protein
MMTKTERKLRSFESLQIALAIEEAKFMATTPEIDQRVESLYLAGRREIAKLRYAENVRWPVTIGSDTVRPSILEMSRKEVDAHLSLLRVTYPQLQYAHRDCEALSDHDLRTLLEDAMRLTEGKE